MAVIADNRDSDATFGRVTERLIVPVLKTGVPERVPWVQIPPLPFACGLQIAFNRGLPCGYHEYRGTQTRQERKMIQCKDCEHFSHNAKGEIAFSCDPFTNVKEPECLAKWQLIKINQMVAGYQATLQYYSKLAPLQEKMFKVVERELEDMNESEQWRNPPDQDEESDEDSKDGKW